MEIMFCALPNQLSFKTISQKLNQHAGGKWLIYGTKHNKDKQLQSMEPPLWNILVENINLI